MTALPSYQKRFYPAWYQDVMSIPDSFIMQRRNRLCFFAWKVRGFVYEFSSLIISFREPLIIILQVEETEKNMETPASQNIRKRFKNKPKKPAIAGQR